MDSDFGDDFGCDGSRAQAPPDCAFSLMHLFCAAKRSTSPLEFEKFSRITHPVFLC